MPAAPPQAASRATIPGLWWKIPTGLWMVATILFTFFRVGPASGFLNNEGARLLIFHVPCAWLSIIAYIAGTCYAIAHLRKTKAVGFRKAEEQDIKCATSMELGLLFAVLTTVTGSIFSRIEWNSFWSWDPRQTSILIVLLIYAAYVVLRGAVADPESRGRLSAVYTLASVVPGIFLLVVLPRIVATLHGDANNTVVGNQMGGNYRIAMYLFSLPSFIGIFVWLFHLRVRILKIVARREVRAVN